MHSNEIKTATRLDGAVARTAAIVFFLKSILTLVESLVGQGHVQRGILSKEVVYTNISRQLCELYTDTQREFRTYKA